MEPVDMSKYKIRQKAPAQRPKGSPSSPKKFLQHVAKGVGLLRLDKSNSDKPGKTNGSNSATSVDTGISINGSNQGRFHIRSKSEGSDKDIHKALDTLDNVIQAEQPSIDDKCPFKISSTEDNYIFNKLKAKTLRTRDFSRLDKTTIERDEEAATTQETTLNTIETKPSYPSEKDDWIVNHRSRIAKLKRKFFESDPPNRKLHDTKHITSKSIHVDNFTNVAQSQNEGHPSKHSETSNASPNPYPKPPRTDSKMPEHFSTESRATALLRKAKVEIRGHYRRHSTEGVLGRSRAFDSIHRMSYPVDWDEYLGQYLAVVAIDFGTTYSGYAYCFTNEPDTVHVMRKQEGGDPGVFNQKTPTTILLTPTGHFHSFGYGARDFYHDLDPKEAPKWMFFDRFKMLLHQEGLIPWHYYQNWTDKNPQTKVVICLTIDGKQDSYERSAVVGSAGEIICGSQIVSRYISDHRRYQVLLPIFQKLSKESVLRTSNGKEVSAMKIFSYSLAYFKDLALQELTDQSDTRITCDVIRWVITVPAIWKASAKQFMRQAAYEAGIVPTDRPDQLLIALEPEAASIYCRRLRMHHILSDDFSRSNSSETSGSTLSLPELRSTNSGVVTTDLPVGTRYMVVDCGGGTVDITVHQLLEEGRLRELHRASGGAHGSVGVDEEFEILLVAIFGKDIVEQFKKKRPAGWVDLMVVFESRKRTASPYRSSNIAVSIPFSFIDFYKKCRGSSVESAVKRFGDDDVTWTSNGMLRLAPGAMRRLFLPTVDRIKQAVGAVLNDPRTRDLKYMFLVGGFAESSVIQHEMRKDFGQLLKVIIPPAVSMTIVKGAVYFGMDPQVVAERCSCLTYGVGVLHRFDPVRHPKNKLVTKDGVDWCTDIFDKFVHLNETVALGDKIVRRYTPIRRDQTTTTIHIYSTNNDNATFISEFGVVRCGTLNLKLAGVGLLGERREIRTEMQFGDTEIKVTATDVKSGNSVEAEIDFMSS